METPAHRRHRGLLLGGGGGAVEGALLRGLGGLGARALVLRAAPQVGGRAVDEPLQGTGLRSGGLSCHRTRAHAHASVRPCMHHRHKRRGISANASVLIMHACVHACITAAAIDSVRPPAAAASCSSSASRAAACLASTRACFCCRRAPNAASAAACRAAQARRACFARANRRAAPSATPSHTSFAWARAPQPAINMKPRE
jgi:hypothetical protein